MYNPQQAMQPAVMYMPVPVQNTFAPPADPEMQGLQKQALRSQVRNDNSSTLLNKLCACSACLDILLCPVRLAAYCSFIDGD